MLRWLLIVHLINPIRGDSQELVLINKLNSFFQFDHNLFLIESTTIIDRYIISPGSIERNSNIPQTVYVVNGIQDDIKFKPIINSKNILMIIALKSNILEQNLRFLDKVKEFQRDYIDLKIGLFFTQSFRSSDDLLKLFRWFWQHTIISIFVGFPAERRHGGNLSQFVLNTYTYNPFGTFELINLTENTSLDKYFPRICHNLRQHSIRIAIYDDINSFIYSKGNPNFGGPDGKLWQTIFRLINASYTLVKFIGITDGQDIQQMAMSGTIDLGPQASRVSNVKPMNLYPIYTDTVAIVVPSALPYSAFTTYLKTFADDTVFGVSLLTILVVTITLTLFRYIKRHRMTLFESAADVINLFLSNNMAIDYRDLYRIEVFIILPLTMTGLIIINVVLSILTSHLTQSMDQPEINTFAEIESSTFPVMVPTKKNMEELLHIFKSNWNIDWSHKMSSTTLEDFRRQIFSFNTSICFVYWGREVKNLLEHQNRLNIRGYRIPEQTISRSLYGYVVSVDYPLKDCLNEMIHRIMFAGLYWKWTDESYIEIVKQGYFSDTHVNHLDPMDSDSENYDVLLSMAYGWAAGTLVFFIEIVWSELKSLVFGKRNVNLFK